MLMPVVMITMWTMMVVTMMMMMMVMRMKILRSRAAQGAGATSFMMVFEGSPPPLNPKP